MAFEMALGEANILLDMKPDCKACGMGIACCGCPKDRKYRTERKAFLNDLKGDIVTLDHVTALAGAIRNEAQLKEELANTQGCIKQLYEILTSKLEQAAEMKTNLFGE